MAVIQISIDPLGHIIVPFSYEPLLLGKRKSLKAMARLRKYIHKCVERIKKFEFEIWGLGSSFLKIGDCKRDTDIFNNRSNGESGPFISLQIFSNHPHLRKEEKDG